MASYYDRAATPMNMMIDLDTMEIVRINVGFDESATEALIQGLL